jgi:DNA repair exonuclease SbcCD nuclease subunit
MRTRFLHTSDWQLGMSRHFLDEDAQARFSAARISAVEKIARVVLEQGCEFAVVAGDVFDSNQVDRRTIARGLEALRGIPVPVLLLPGNHDALDVSSVYGRPEFTSSCPEHVRCLNSFEPFEVRPGVELIGVPWKSRSPTADLVGRACAELGPKHTPFRVMVAHGGVDEVVFDTADPSLIRLEAAERAIAEGKLDYLALGDRHSTTIVGSTERIRYSGTPEPTSYVESAPGNVLVVELDGDSLTVETIPVSTWRFGDREFTFDLASDLEQVRSDLAALPDKSCTILRLALRGTLSLSGKAAFDTVLEEARNVFAAVEVWERRSDLAILPDDADFADLDLAGFAEEAVAELRQAALTGDEEARDALALLVRLAGGGR